MSRKAPLLVLVAGITIAGLLLRLPSFDDALFGDEISTYFIASSDSLRGAVDLVRSDQEVTPPLYFVLAWATEGLGDPAQSLRLTPLIAGVAAIPLTYWLGALTVGRHAALTGAALVALSPILIVQSTEARGHAVMLVLVLLSTLALVKALRPARHDLWWVAYAAFSCAAVWTHYTAVFVLAGQLGWAMWLRPDARRALLVANVVAALGYVPWLVSGLGEDRSSPGNLIDLLHPFSLESAATDVGQWAIGGAIAPLTSLPGEAAIAMIVAGIGVSALGLVVAIRARSDPPLWRPPDGTLLILVLALATPVGAMLYSLVFDSLVTPRNLIASWPGLALAVGAIASSGRGLLRVVALGLVLAGFSIGATKMLDADYQRPDYASAASFIEEVGGPESPVLELPYAVNPLSSLEVALNDPGQSLHQDRKVLRVGTPTRRAQEGARAAGAPPALPLPAPTTENLARRAGELARGGTLFVLVQSASTGAISPESVLGAVPSRFREVETRIFPGLAPVTVYVFRDGGDLVSR